MGRSGNGRAQAARPAEAGALTELVLRSKAHWGYGAEFLAACAPELRIGAGDVVRRRIVVAQGAAGARSGGGPAAVLGLASLDGEPPLGRLGLLFVEPAAIGSGVGRLLYRDVLRRAAGLGFRRLLIDADPHATGFYRAMGAVASGPEPEPEPGPEPDAGPDATGGLVRFEVAPVPLADWARAWTGGRAAVHVGNVAEYNAQFADASLDREQHAAHHYACLAAFYSPRPAALVLPRPVPPGWISLLGRQLDWPAGVEVYDGLAERDPGLSDAVRSRPALAARLTGTAAEAGADTGVGAEAGAPLVPWGLTAPFARLARRPWRPDELRYESKSAAHGLFGRILAEGGHPAITLPAQWRADTRRTAVRLLASRTKAGESTVLKSEHGVGGSGTTVMTPGRVRAAGGARAVVRRCRADRCWWRSTYAVRRIRPSRATSRTTGSWTRGAACTRSAGRSWTWRTAGTAGRRWVRGCSPGGRRNRCSASAAQWAGSCRPPATGAGSTWTSSPTARDGSPRRRRTCA